MAGIDPTRAKAREVELPHSSASQLSTNSSVHSRALCFLFADFDLANCR